MAGIIRAAQMDWLRSRYRGGGSACMDVHRRKNATSPKRGPRNVRSEHGHPCPIRCSNIAPCRWTKEKRTGHMFARLLCIRWSVLRDFGIACLCIRVASHQVVASDNHSRGHGAPAFAAKPHASCRHIVSAASWPWAVQHRVRVPYNLCDTRHRLSRWVTGCAWEGGEIGKRGGGG